MRKENKIYVKAKKVCCRGESKNDRHPIVYLSLLNEYSVICQYCRIVYINHDISNIEE